MTYAHTVTHVQYSVTHAPHGMNYVLHGGASDD